MRGHARRSKLNWFLGLPLSILLVLSLLFGGCARGLFRQGPVGQGEKGIGLKVPILDLMKSESYEADQFTADNIDEEKVNPFREKTDSEPKQEEEYSRYQEQ